MITPRMILGFLQAMRSLRNLDRYNREQDAAREAERLDRLRHPEKYRGQKKP